MSQNISHIESLIEWAEFNHSSLNSAVEVYEDPITGLSFRAKGNILPTTRLVECSYKTTLSYLNAIEANSNFSRNHPESFPNAFIDALSPNDPNIIGHFFLVQQYLLGEKSFWWPYIRLLPQPHQPKRLGIPIWWPEADQRFLDGTNAEPPVRKRRELWESEWSHGISILRDYFQGWEAYTYILYQWAATIFGSRSFRASLTISNESTYGLQHTQADSTWILDHIRKDRFSILLPVLDIGNHNGVNQIDWASSGDKFSLSNRSTIPKDSQIYNYYGDKSNSELLVGYGFILPTIDKDRVNLKVTPSPEIQELRRSQNSHRSDPNQPEKEFMFDVRMNALGKRGREQESEICVEANTEQANPTSLGCFSDGLFDTTTCMVANARERRYILNNTHYCPERDPTVFVGPLARSTFQALELLKAKIEYEIARLEQSRPSERPQSTNQELANNYRNRQLDVLAAALPLISWDLQTALSRFLSLDSAFDWLRTQHPEICLIVETLISEDQEEPLPLNWNVLAEDWDHTYWIVWIYIILSFEALDPVDFRSRRPALSMWISDIRGSQHQLNEQLFAEASELETINHMIDSIAPRFSHDAVGSQKLRNFASYITKEERVRGSCENGLQNCSGVDQDLLCVVIHV